MVTAARHDIRWLAPQPLWPRAGGNGNDGNPVQRPAILRFVSDTFMEEFQATLTHDPSNLGEWVARPETWREPTPAPKTRASLRLAEPPSEFQRRLDRRLATAKQRRGESVDPPAPVQTAGNAGTTDDTLPLKLYQPSQQRFYLVTASVVCRKPGLPDRAVDAGKQERVSYVVRRLIQGPGQDANLPATWDEHAFVMGPTAPAWRRVNEGETQQARRIVQGEERLPLFGVDYFETDERKRRLLGGVIPVGRREAYLGAPPYQAPASGTDGDSKTRPNDLRREVFDAQVTGPWSELAQKADQDRERLTAPTEPSALQDEFGAPANEFAAVRFRKNSREQIQTVSWYVLLDFAKYLEQHLPELWEVVVAAPQAEAALLADLPDNQQDVFVQLVGTVLSNPLALVNPIYDDLADIKTTLRDALAAIRGGRPKDEAKAVTLEKNLEKVDQPYDRDGAPVALDPLWPDFLFPLADCQEDNPLPPAGIEGLADLIEDALIGPPIAPDTESALKTKRIFDTREAWFTIRCIFERPNCGPFEPPVVSDPTEPFQLASFFDPDAPARPIRIPMPVDISVAGLRKYKKNTGLIISDLLCGQIKRIRKLTLADLVLSVLPWPFHKDLPDPGETGPCKEGDDTFGMICSLSIPIVTLCALILLIIMVALFDMFFKWIPYLFVCLPIGLLKGKKP